MQAFQHAFGSQDLLAPAPFREALKRAFPRVELDCWFSPGDVRTEIVRGIPMKHMGCWVIWMKCTEGEIVDLGGGIKVSHPRTVWAPAFKMDGSFELPTTPGAWTIKALLESDMTRECNRDRHAFINRLHAEDQMNMYAARKKMHEEISKDKVWKNILRKQDERAGKETMSGDDRKAWVKEWDRLEKKDLAEAERRAKEVQFYKR